MNTFKQPRIPGQRATRMAQVTQERLDKAILPLIKTGTLVAEYSTAQATTFYTTIAGRQVGMTRNGKHYAQVAA
ncbi:hypothetical protein K32_48510 [Kaistia sp. 32K]|uniref:hypothetical protein n=1 Tax=Kaistia sp. 32K TaxID=2795690 RepID=UPI001916B6F8|nr:hypothetical protein [Kaistia sp. 32K]BCP56234.1 hypothetical protein K32_48510 [Kaistia sp. 32K]